MLLGMIRARRGTSAGDHLRGTASIHPQWDRAFLRPFLSWPDRFQDRRASFRYFRDPARARSSQYRLPPGGDAWLSSGDNAASDITAIRRQCTFTWLFLLPL